ncbi:uncharacterized protein PFL1_02936 [Pseudozyma flocculosa PF-1]|uniref:Glutaredoxin-like protein n=2 Tax=Pseudozyma flocculosa TaxID=84751 RepID=A0A5C3F198_9BASI|nr:uncharacterized protein PFL1_02936 [Pseudozyma flocculosa PF-1]EPQ29716.1 hypothetical protein PFL1_02936 [Pseudozyma flocculosa PF-1]SPO38294.1 uncharacterized protein PSFLO_03771 [Pseudozyma flocculosa]
MMLNTLSAFLAPSVVGPSAPSAYRGPLRLSRLAGLARHYFATSSIRSTTPTAPPPPPPPAGQARLTLYTGPQCDLCTVMRIEIEKAANVVPLALSTYNIRDDSLPDVAKWRRKYQYDIPVLHLDDKGEYSKIFRHRLKAEDLVKVIREAQAQEEVQTQPREPAT